MKKSEIYLIKNINCKNELLHEVMNSNVDFNKINQFGEPIFKVLISENPLESEIVKHVFSKNIELNIQNRQGETVLYEAISKKDWRKADVLVEKGANINFQNVFGETLLTTFLKICIGDFSPVMYLLEKGANINLRNHKKESPFILACVRDVNNLVMWLLEHNVGITKEESIWLRYLSELHKEEIESNFPVIFKKYELSDDGLKYKIVTNESLEEHKDLIDRYIIRS